MVILDFRKVIAVFTTFLFIATSINFNSELYAQPMAASLPALDIHKITVNGSAASLEERFQGHEGPNSRTVIAVQDAHGIFDAQENIRVIIQELQDQYGFELVGLEGGVGKSDHTFLRTFPDKEINAEQARKYMKRAELSGGEAAAILNPKPGIFYGIENRDLYFQNRNSFINALEHKDANLHSLHLLEKKLDKIRSNLFPEKLLAFHKSVQNFRRGRMSLLDFALVLQSESVAAAVVPGQYPNVLRLFEAIAKARKAGNKEAVNKEVQDVTSKIEGRVLFEEIDKMTEVILSQSAKPQSRKIEELLTQYHELNILRNLVTLQLTRKEYEEFVGAGLAPARGRPQGSPLQNLHLAPAETFYRDAVKRDAALYENFIAAMKREKKDRAIIVTGGFHEEGLRDRLRKENISYVFYAPRIQTITPQDDYYRVMEGKVSYNNKNGRTSSIQAILATMGLDPKLEKEFNQAYAVGGLRALAKEVGSAGSLQPYANIWQDAIIKTIKERGETLRDPSDLIMLVKNAVQLATGKADVDDMLEKLRQSFNETLSGEARNRVNRFIDDLKQNDFNAEKTLMVQGASLGMDSGLGNLIRKMEADPEDNDLSLTLASALVKAGRINDSIKILRDRGFTRRTTPSVEQRRVEVILNQMAEQLRVMQRTEEEEIWTDSLDHFLRLVQGIEWRFRISVEPGRDVVFDSYVRQMQDLTAPVFLNKRIDHRRALNYLEAFDNPQFQTDIQWFSVEPETFEVRINLAGHRVTENDFHILSRVRKLILLDLASANYQGTDLGNFLRLHPNREYLEIYSSTGAPVIAASLGGDRDLAGKQRLAAADLLNDEIQTSAYWNEIRQGQYLEAFSRIQKLRQFARSFEDRNLLKARVFQTAQRLVEPIQAGRMEVEAMFRFLEILGAFNWNESEMNVIRPIRADILAREGMAERITQYSNQTRQTVRDLFDLNDVIIHEAYLDARISINRETLGIKLDLSNSGLGEITTLSKMPNLEELYLRGNPLKNIKPLEKLIRLRLLYLNWTQANDIGDLVNLYRLERVELNQTKINDASAFSFFRAPENPRETRTQKLLRILRSFWRGRPLSPIRHPEWTALTIVNSSAQPIRWQGTPELGSPEVIPELPVEEIVEVQGASLGAGIRERILEKISEIVEGLALMFALSAVTGCGSALAVQRPLEPRPTVLRVSEDPVKKEFEQLKEKLSGNDWFVKNDALKRLVELVKKNPELGNEGFKLLTERLWDSDLYVHKEALLAMMELVKIKPEFSKEAFGYVKEKLSHRYWVVQKTSLLVLPELVKINPELAKEALKLAEGKFLNNNMDVGMYSERAFAEIVKASPDSWQEAMNIVMGKLPHSDWNVRTSALRVLAEILKINPKLGKEILNLIKEKFSDSYLDIRIDVLGIFLTFAKDNPEFSKEVFELAKKNLSDDSSSVRQAALMALVALVKINPEFGEEVFKLLKGKLSDSNSSVRWEAIGMLAELVKVKPEFSKEIFELLKERISNNDSEGQQSAILGFAKLVNVKPEFKKEAFNLVLEKVFDSDVEVRSKALKSLRAIGGVKAVFQALRLKLKDPNQDIKDMAYFVLQGMLEDSVTEEVMLEVLDMKSEGAAFYRDLIEMVLEKNPALMSNYLKLFNDPKYGEMVRENVSFLPPTAFTPEALLNLIDDYISSKDESSRDWGFKVLRIFEIKNWGAFTPENLKQLWNLYFKSVDSEAELNLLAAYKKFKITDQLELNKQIADEADRQLKNSKIDSYDTTKILISRRALMKLEGSKRFTQENYESALSAFQRTKNLGVKREALEILRAYFIENPEAEYLDESIIILEVFKILKTSEDELLSQILQASAIDFLRAVFLTINENNREMAFVLTQRSIENTDSKVRRSALKFISRVSKDDPGMLNANALREIKQPLENPDSNIRKDARKVIEIYEQKARKAEVRELAKDMLETAVKAEADKAATPVIKAQGASLGSAEEKGLCVTGDTLLPINGKLIPIKDVRVGDQVLSLNESTGQVEPHRINALLDMGVKPVYKLTTASGRSIKTTANHPYLVEGGGKNSWVKVSELRVGEKIACPRERTWSAAASTSENEDAFYDHARLGISKREEKELSKMQLSGHPWSLISFFRNHNQAYNKENGNAKIDCNSQPIGKSTEKIAGHTQSKKRFGQIANIFCGMIPFCSIQSFHGREVITIFNNNQQKYNYFKLIKPAYASDIPLSRGVDAKSGVCDILWDPIVSIEPLGREHVYDIEVDGTHNFIGNGIFAHNTYVQQKVASTLSQQGGTLPATGASLGAGILQTFRSFPADAWIGSRLMQEFRKKNGGKEVRVIQLSGSAGEIQAQLAQQLKNIPDADYVFAVLDVERQGAKAMDHVVVMDTAQKIRKESARLTSLGGVALNLFQYVLVLNVHFAGIEDPPLFTLDTISISPELRGKRLMSETFSRVAGTLKNKFSGMPISALATNRITANWFNEYFRARIMWSDDLQDYYKYLSMNLDLATLAKMHEHIIKKFPSPEKFQTTAPELSWAIEKMEPWPSMRLWGTIGAGNPAPALVTGASLGAGMRDERLDSEAPLAPTQATRRKIPFWMKAGFAALLFVLPYQWFQTAGGRYFLRQMEVNFLMEFGEKTGFSEYDTSTRIRNALEEMMGYDPGWAADFALNVYASGKASEWMGHTLLSYIEKVDSTEMLPHFLDEIQANGNKLKSRNRFSREVSGTLLTLYVNAHGRADDKNARRKVSEMILTHPALEFLYRSDEIQLKLYALHLYGWVISGKRLEWYDNAKEFHENFNEVFHEKTVRTERDFQLIHDSFKSFENTFPYSVQLFIDSKNRIALQALARVFELLIIEMEFSEKDVKKTETINQFFDSEINFLQNQSDKINEALAKIPVQGASLGSGRDERGQQMSRKAGADLEDNVSAELSIRQHMIAGRQADAINEIQVYQRRALDPEERERLHGYIFELVQQTGNDVSKLDTETLFNYLQVLGRVDWSPEREERTRILKDAIMRVPAINERIKKYRQDMRAVVTRMLEMNNITWNEEAWQDRLNIAVPPEKLILQMRLNLNDVNVSDAALVHLPNLTNLIVLKLAHTNISDAGLANVSGLRNLWALSLSNTKVSNAGLAYLMSLNNLTSLDLTDTQITQEQAQVFHDAHPNRQNLIIFGGEWIIKAASLGKLSSDELQFLASELGFGIFEGNRADVLASLNEKINAGNVDVLSAALYQHILAGLPQLFDNQQDTVRFLLQSKRVLNETDARKIAEDLMNQDAFRDLAWKPEVREKLVKAFTGIVQGAGLEVMDAKRKAEALVRDEALEMFNENFATPQSRALIEAVFFEDFKEKSRFFAIAQDDKVREKYQIVPHIGSLAQDREGVKLFISNAFAAVPEGSSVQIDVLYPRGSKERVDGLESYLEEVRKSLPEFASRIRMRELDQRDLVSKLSSYEKRAERDPNQYLIMVMPDAEMAAQVRGASVMIVNDSEIPDELEFVKGYVSKAAVGLAKALKLPKDDPHRTKYLGLLAEAGLTATEDAASGQIIISLNLRQFVQHLVDLQRAQAAIAKAA